MNSGISVREANVSDAPAIQEYLCELVKEQPPVLFRRDQAPTLDEEETFLKMIDTSERSVVFMAEVGGKVVGMLDFHGHKKEQCAHCGGFGMSVHHAWRHRGIGSLLLKELFNWASSRNFRRIELEVFSNNLPAISLYNKLGFMHEGRKSEAVSLDGWYVDILQMVKIV